MSAYRSKMMNLTELQYKYDSIISIMIQSYRPLHVEEPISRCSTVQRSHKVALLKACHGSRNEGWATAAVEKLGVLLGTHVNIESNIDVQWSPVPPMPDHDGPQYQATK